jgi:hypothetical protein
MAEIGDNLHPAIRADVSRLVELIAEKRALLADINEVKRRFTHTYGVNKEAVKGWLDICEKGDDALRATAEGIRILAAAHGKPDPLRRMDPEPAATNATNGNGAPQSPSGPEGTTTSAPDEDPPEPEGRFETLGEHVAAQLRNMPFIDDVQVAESADRSAHPSHY